MECAIHNLHVLQGLVIERLERGLLLPFMLDIALQRVWDDAVEGAAGSCDGVGGS